MSAQSPSNFVEWWQSLPIPWLVAGANGQNEALSNGTVLDLEVARLKDSAKVIMPGQAPSDALPHIGNDRGLIQGPSETGDNFRTRLKTAWDDWARAGTPLELLVQLYWIGFSGAIIVQQNGLSFTLTGAPTAGVDPTSLLDVEFSSKTGVAVSPSPLYQGNPSLPAFNPNGYSKVIPADNPWWAFDSKTDFCSRFAIIFPQPPPPFYTVGRATFTASSTAALTWSNAFPDTTYVISVGAPVVTDGSPGPIVWADSATKTATGITIDASGAFTGYVDCWAWQAGANPFADPHPADLGRLQSVIRSWRRATQTCLGVYVATQGKFFGWPAQPQGSNTMGTATIVRFDGA